MSDGRMEGLDIYLDGRAGGNYAHMEASFGSATFWRLLKNPEFQVLPRIWRYASTMLPAEDIPGLRDEVRVIRELYRVTPLAGPVVVGELDALEQFLNEAIDLEVGVWAYGP